MKWNEMSGEVTFLRMPRSKPKTSAEGQEQLSHSLARMAAAPIASKRVPITEIGFGQCRFIIDDRTFPALCCGELTLGGSWCAHHRALVFVRVAAPNHKKSGQELPKASADMPEAAPNGSVKRQEAAAAKPAQNRAAPAANQKPKPQPAQPPAQGNIPAKPAKDAKPPQGMTAKKDITGAQRDAQGHKGGMKSPAQGEGKQAEAAAVKRSGQSVSAKQPEPTRKGTAAKPASKKAETMRKAGTAKPVAPAKKAEAGRKSSTAGKRPAPAKKAPASRKSNTAKRPAPVKKGAAAKSPAKKASGKKASAGKRKRR